VSLAKKYERFVALLREQAEIAAALHLLEWDRETYMPPGAAATRAGQIGTLAGVLHERRTDPEFLDLLDELAANISALAPHQAVDVREAKWEIDRLRVLDADFVRFRAALHTLSRAAWAEAREKGSFALFAPFLERVFAVERSRAAAIRPEAEPYEVLFEDYEPDISASRVRGMLERLRDALLPLVARLEARGDRAASGGAALRGNFPVWRQRELSRVVAARIGFDFEWGRLDESVHPFTSACGLDVRLTTHYRAEDLRCGLLGTLHELGHGLYEQGLDREAWGTPRGAACSFAVHESQSRFWENHVGRSRGFWSFVLPLAREFFPALESVGLDAALNAVNELAPSPIRVEADEVTYPLHIVIPPPMRLAMCMRRRWHARSKGKSARSTSWSQRRDSPKSSLGSASASSGGAEHSVGSR